MSAKTNVVEVHLSGRDASERETFRILDEIIKKVDRDKPAPEDLRKLRDLFDTTPVMARVLCDVAQINADKVIKSLSSGTVAIEAITRNARAMRDDMGYETALGLERAMIDHIVLCWLRLQKVEHTYTAEMAESHTFARGAYWERRLTGAQHRYLKACESLARVRRLTQPAAVQVNIARRQQVNTALVQKVTEPAEG